MATELLPQTQRACLAIADISGYTGYLAGSELTHAQDVLADLMETVIGGLRPVLRLAKLEGDGAFVYAVDPALGGSTLLDTIEGCYFRFQRRLRNIGHATTCQCNACILIPKLNLKFFVHHGSFIRHRIAGHEEFAGTDVILVHRLLKNSVTETHRLNGYALFTQASVDATGVEPIKAGMLSHHETYDHIGEVPVYLHNLEVRWEREREARRVVVDPANTEIDATMTLPAPLSLVWEFLTDPTKRSQYLTGADRVEEFSPKGRRGVGTTNHCVHGPHVIVEEVLDWRPLESFTIRANVPGLGAMTYTFEVTPAQTGTVVRFMMEKMKNRKQVEAWHAMREQWQADMQKTIQHLTTMLAEEMTRRGSEVEVPPSTSL